MLQGILGVKPCKVSVMDCSSRSSSSVNDRFLAAALGRAIVLSHGCGQSEAGFVVLRKASWVDAWGRDEGQAKLQHADPAMRP